MRIRSQESGNIYIRKNVTLPEVSATELKELKRKLGGISESEVLRRLIHTGNILTDSLADAKKELLLRDKETGEEIKILLIL